METAFSYPSPNWVIVAFFAFAPLGAYLLRNLLAAIFIGLVALILTWFAHEIYLPKHIESWLTSQREYAILFNDFPKNKKRIIDEYMTAFKTDGELGVARKHEEMKIVMMGHFVKHYIAHAPTDVIHNYIVSEAWLLSTLNTKNRVLCTNYLISSGYFEDVWRTVGSDIFTMSLRYVPFLISESVDHPEEVNPGDQARALQLFEQMLTSLQKSESLEGHASCDTVYREYYLLSQMPPKDSALILKLILSEDHLKDSSQKSFLQQLLPFQ